MLLNFCVLFLEPNLPQFNFNRIEASSFIIVYFE